MPIPAKFWSIYHDLLLINRVATNLKNQGVRKIVKISGKTQENWNFHIKKTWKTQGKCKVCGIIANEKCILLKYSLLNCSEKRKEKFETDLEISGKTQGI